MSTSRLAELLSIERSTVVRDIQVLERMGLVVVEKPELCDRIILEFLENDPVATVAPIRRRKG